jgi:hypothetical protein
MIPLQGIADLFLWPSKRVSEAVQLASHRYTDPLSLVLQSLRLLQELFSVPIASPD